MHKFKLHTRGLHYSFWVTWHGSNCPVWQYVNGLDKRAQIRFRNYFHKTRSEGLIDNVEHHRHLGDAVWEYKFETARIFSFHDFTISHQKRIILTHGAKKPKSYTGDIQHVINLRELYGKDRPDEPGE